MFRSKLSIFTTIFGWIVLIVYLLYRYYEHGSLTRHFFYEATFIESMFNVMILSAPIGSTITGYLIHTRSKLLEDTQDSREKLRHASNEWRTTFDSMPYGVMLTDGNFNVVRVNNYFADLTGFPIKEMVFNKKCYEITLRRDRPCDGCTIKIASAPMLRETIEHYDENSKNYFMENIAPMYDNDGSVVAYVHSMVDINEMKEKEKQLIESKEAFFNMLKDVDSTHKELKDIYNNLVIAFSNVIDAKSAWTKGHSVNVASYSVAIARAIGLSEDEILILQTAALLHDIGKIGTYDQILDKQDKLSDDEFALIRKHPVQGEKILSPIKGLESILPIIRHHHEKVDGSGYPDRLKGDEISLLAKILSVADAYDSMVTSRPYRSSRGKEYAALELKRCAGTQFDPEIVDVFLEVLKTEGIGITAEDLTTH